MPKKQTVKQTREDLAIIRQNLEKLAESWQKVMRGISFEGIALQRLRLIPGPPKYPIRWTSERQRRAFFATNGFGRGIPTPRTGKIAADWEVSFVAVEGGGILVLSNPHSAAKFVHGPDPFAQGFHIDTGWTQIDDIQNDFYNEWEGSATQAFFDGVDVFEGL